MRTSRPAVTELAGSDEAASREQNPRLYHLQSTIGNRLSSSVAPQTWVVLSNAASLVGTYVVTSVLGLGFWLLAARHYSKGTIGLTGGLISAMALVGGIASLGFGTMLIGELPTRRNARRALVTSAMTVAALAGAVAGSLFAVVAPLASSEYHPLITTSLLGPVFVIGVGLTSAGMVFDAAAIGALRGGLQLSRNFFFAAAKLAAIVVFAFSTFRGGVWLLSAWIVGLVASMLLIFVRDSRSARSASEYWPRPSLLTNHWRDAVGHQAYNIAYTLPVLTLPIVVLGLASATANATFYVALQVAGALYVVPIALTTVLFAAGAADLRSVPARLRLTLRLSLAIVVLGVGAFAAAGGRVIDLFGASYAGGGSVLVVLSLAALPLTVKTHFVAVTRIERQVSNRLGLVWAGAAAEVVGGAVGAAHSGAKGAAIGWLVALCIEAVAMAPVVGRALKPRGAA